MSFFDDDPFENILREFFGEASRASLRKEEFIKGEEEDRIIDFVTDGKNVYLVFELPGYSEKDVSVSVKGKELIINIQKPHKGNVQTYLYSRLSQGETIRKKLPVIANPRNFSYTMKNGVLEIVFDRRKNEAN